MFNTDRMENESELQYIWRMCSAKDSGVLDLTWEELTTILNKNLREDDEEWTSSAYRKKYQQARAFYDEVFSKMESEKFHKELMEQKRMLERSKIQFRDERNAWNKQNYIDARVEQKLDYLEKSLKDLGKINYINHNPVVRKNDNEMIVMLSDLHIGQYFNNTFGEYNSDIAVTRLNKYFDSVCEYGKLYNISNITIVACGDLISGNLHKTIQVTNRENVIDQIKLAADIITSFCYRCSETFKNVTFYNVAGNHSRIDAKDDAIHDERLDDLIGWIIGKSLSHINNFKYIKNVFDNGIAVFEVLGKSYTAVHGDYDSATKNGVGNLSMMLGFIPYAILRGHFHYPSYEEINGIKVIQSGSLVGTGDQYTLEKRLTGSPSQTILICDKTGIISHIPVQL